MKNSFFYIKNVFNNPLNTGQSKGMLLLVLMLTLVLVVAL